MVLTNWAGNHQYRAADILTPRSIDELADVLGNGPAKVIGTRHTFSDIGDGERLISLSGLGERFEVAPDRRTVRIDGAMTYGRLCELLAPHGLALANLASLPHISVAGAVATATHGSGLHNGNLATSVRSLTLLTHGGLRRFDEGDAEWRGVVVSLGAVGPVVELVLAVEPVFHVAQTVFHGLRWHELVDDPEAILGSAYSVSLFTRFGDEPGALWVKRRVGRDDEVPPPGAALVPATTPQHPLPDHPGETCTEQLGVAGLWSERLPHFRLGFTPSSGDEIQSEYFVAFEHAAAAIEALRRVGSELDSALLVSELRAVAGDDHWLSPQCDGPTFAMHFTWGPNAAMAAAGARVVERALAPLEPRPHWGKHFSAALDVGPRYRDLSSFLALRDRLDPAGRFISPWFERTLGIS